jgi:hypothetical protein
MIAQRQLSFLLAVLVMARLPRFLSAGRVMPEMPQRIASS